MNEQQSVIEFEAFPKIARYRRDVVITEKLDGTNAAVLITDDGQVLAQSRTRFVTPADDNYGFARWVKENEAALAEQLGPGRHFGEWWGQGIQRKYGLSEKRFSLFNVHRWHGSPENDWQCIEAPLCFVVPTLATIENNYGMIAEVLVNLHHTGSHAAPGFMNPEGIVIFHTRSQGLYKITFEHDDKGKERGA